jgi:hypothetical protein
MAKPELEPSTHEHGRQNMVEQQKPPPGIGVEGKKLWRHVARAVAADDLELTAVEQLWLASAARLTDRVAELEAAIDGADMILPGYNGQPVAHPLLTEIRQHHLLISQTLARLKVDVPEEPGVLGVAGEQGPQRC